MAPRFAGGFPTHIDPHDVAIKFAGAGGDGAQTIAKLTSLGAIHEGFDSTYIPSYGPESRGGTSYADVHLATDEVLSPAAPRPHVLVAFNLPSLEKFGPAAAQRRGIRPRQKGIRRGESKLVEDVFEIFQLRLPASSFAVDDRGDDQYEGEALNQVEPGQQDRASLLETRSQRLVLVAWQRR